MSIGAPVTICVPHGNNPEKNDAMRSLGAEPDYARYAVAAGAC